MTDDSPDNQRPVFLGIDTGASEVTVAVGDSSLVEEAVLPLGNSSSELLDAIDQTLQRASCTIREVTGVLCTSGPGSFTGLRIGMATVLGLHESLGIPAVALPSLWVQVAALDFESHQDALITSVLAAHRDQVYLQKFLRSSTFRSPSLATRVQAPAPKSRGPIATTLDVEQHLEAEVTVVSADAVLRDRLAPMVETVLDPGRLASALVQLAVHSPPEHPGLFEWKSDTLTRPLYAQTPAVAARPQARPRSGATARP